eukprot:14223961-Alexandrium_andersonii.AAC.1
MPALPAAQRSYAPSCWVELPGPPGAARSARGPAGARALGPLGMGALGRWAACREAHPSDGAHPGAARVAAAS